MINFSNAWLPCKSAKSSSFLKKIPKSGNSQISGKVSKHATLEKAPQTENVPKIWKSLANHVAHEKVSQNGENVPQIWKSLTKHAIRQKSLTKRKKPHKSGKVSQSMPSMKSICTCINLSATYCHGNIWIIYDGKLIVTTSILL